MSPDNVRCLLFLVVGPGLTVLAYTVGYLFDVGPLMLPGKVMGGLCRGFACLLASLAPIAYVPLLLVAVGIVATIPGAWVAVLALGVGRMIARH